MKPNIRLKVYKAGSRWTYDVVKRSRSTTLTWTNTNWPVVWEGLYYTHWEEAFKHGRNTLCWYVEGYEMGIKADKRAMLSRD